MGRAGAVAKGGARSRSSREARGRRPARLSRSELQPEVKPSKGEMVEGKGRGPRSEEAVRGNRAHISAKQSGAGDRGRRESQVKVTD